MDYIDLKDVPIGFCMALAQDAPALQYFASLSNPQKVEIIQQTRQIRSKEQMRNFVHGMGNVVE